jgi:hypothetical protein
MNENGPMYPVNFMPEVARHAKLKDSSLPTRISIREMVRISRYTD